eukprot:gene440-594_t
MCNSKLDTSVTASVTAPVPEPKKKTNAWATMKAPFESLGINVNTSGNKAF